MTSESREGVYGMGKDMKILVYHIMFTKELPQQRNILIIKWIGEDDLFCEYPTTPIMH